MTPISGKYVVRGRDVVHKVLDSRGVLLNLESGTYYTLNRTGTFVWSLMDGKRDVQGLVEALTEQFQVERGAASRDVEALISDLEREGLVELRDGPA
jgi:hypothetical protein